MSNKALLERIKKASIVKETDILSESKLFSGMDVTPTPIPMLNVALAGDADLGLTSGTTILAGPSKHFKTSFSLVIAAAYMQQNPDAVCLFYDSEFGSPQDYFKTFGVDTDRVVHIPVTNIEDLKFDMMQQLEHITRKDKVIIAMDSLGNIASKKEVEDATNQKSVADMTRAKQMKSLFRMITPHLKMKDIPLLGINHIYMEQGMFPKAIVSGGSGVYYSADNIWIIGRRKDGAGTDIKGYHFVVRIEKSRFVREGSKIPITVSFDGGIKRFSGLLEPALEGGYVVKPSRGWYAYGHDQEGKKFRESDTLSKEFWDEVFENTDFKVYLRNRYRLTPQEIEENEKDSEKEEEKEV